MHVVKDENLSADTPKGPSPDIKYNPDKKYTWTPNDNFVLSGGEFGVILNTFRAILGTPEAAKILLAKQANDIIENIMEKNVEAGIIKEVVE